MTWLVSEQMGADAGEAEAFALATELILRGPSQRQMPTASIIWLDRHGKDSR